MRMNSGMALTCFLVGHRDNSDRCRPERWESLPEAVNGLPSIYGHMLTFIAGAHACIGYRFSVVECVDYSCLSRKYQSADLFVVQNQSPLIHVGARVRV
jgi:cytochrome P450